MSDATPRIQGGHAGLRAKRERNEENALLQQAADSLREQGGDPELEKVFTLAQQGQLSEADRKALLKELELAKAGENTAEAEETGGAEEKNNEGRRKALWAAGTAALVIGIATAPLWGPPALAALGLGGAAAGLSAAMAGTVTVAGVSVSGATAATVGAGLTSSAVNFGMDVWGQKQFDDKEVNWKSTTAGLGFDLATLGLATKFSSTINGVKAGTVLVNEAGEHLAEQAAKEVGSELLERAGSDTAETIAIELTEEAVEEAIKAGTKEILEEGTETAAGTVTSTALTSTTNGTAAATSAPPASGNGLQQLFRNAGKQTAMAWEKTDKRALIGNAGFNFFTDGSRAATVTRIDEGKWDGEVFVAAGFGSAAMGGVIDFGVQGAGQTIANRARQTRQRAAEADIQRTQKIETTPSYEDVTGEALNATPRVDDKGNPIVRDDSLKASQVDPIPPVKIDAATVKHFTDLEGMEAVNPSEFVGNDPRTVMWQHVERDITDKDSYPAQLFDDLADIAGRKHNPEPELDLEQAINELTKKDYYSYLNEYQQRFFPAYARKKLGLDLPANVQRDLHVHLLDTELRELKKTKTITLTDEVDTIQIAETLTELHDATTFTQQQMAYLKLRAQAEEQGFSDQIDAILTKTMGENAKLDHLGVTENNLVDILKEQWNYEQGNRSKPNHIPYTDSTLSPGTLKEEVAKLERYRAHSVQNSEPISSEDIERYTSSFVEAVYKNKVTIPEDIEELKNLYRPFIQGYLAQKRIPNSLTQMGRNNKAKKFQDFVARFTDDESSKAARSLQERARELDMALTDALPGWSKEERVAFINLHVEKSQQRPKQEQVENLLNELENKVDSSTHDVTRVKEELRALYGLEPEAPTTPVPARQRMRNLEARVIHQIKDKPRAKSQGFGSVSPNPARELQLRTVLKQEGFSDSQIDAIIREIAEPSRQAVSSNINPDYDANWATKEIYDTIKHKDPVRVKNIEHVDKVKKAIERYVEKPYSVKFANAADGEKEAIIIEIVDDLSLSGTEKNSELLALAIQDKTSVTERLATLKKLDEQLKDVKVKPEQQYLVQELREITLGEELSQLDLSKISPDALEELDTLQATLQKIPDNADKVESQLINLLKGSVSDSPAKRLEAYEQLQALIPTMKDADGVTSRDAQTLQESAERLFRMNNKQHPTQFDGGHHVHNTWQEQSDKLVKEQTGVYKAQEMDDTEAEEAAINYVENLYWNGGWREAYLGNNKQNGYVNTDKTRSNHASSERSLEAQAYRTEAELYGNNISSVPGAKAKKPVYGRPSGGRYETIEPEFLSKETLKGNLSQRLNTHAKNNIVSFENARRRYIAPKTRRWFTHRALPAERALYDSLSTKYDLAYKPQLNRVLDEINDRRATVWTSNVSKTERKQLIMDQYRELARKHPDLLDSKNRQHVLDILSQPIVLDPGAAGMQYMRTQPALTSWMVNSKDEDAEAEAALKQLEEEVKTVSSDELTAAYNQLELMKGNISDAATLGKLPEDEAEAAIEELTLRQQVIESEFIERVTEQEPERTAMALDYSDPAFQATQTPQDASAGEPAPINIEQMQALQDEYAATTGLSVPSQVDSTQPSIAELQALQDQFEATATTAVPTQPSAQTPMVSQPEFQQVPVYEPTAPAGVVTAPQPAPVVQAQAPMSAEQMLNAGTAMQMQQEQAYMGWMMEQAAAQNSPQAFSGSPALSNSPNSPTQNNLQSYQSQTLQQLMEQPPNSTQAG